MVHAYGDVMQSLAPFLCVGILGVYIRPVHIRKALCPCYEPSVVLGHGHHSSFKASLINFVNSGISPCSSHSAPSMTTAARIMKPLTR